MKGIMKKMAVWVAAAVLLTAVPAARAEDGSGASAVDSGPASTGFSTMAASTQTEEFIIKMEDGSAVPTGDYTYANDILTISGSGSYTVSMAPNTETAHKIVVENACTLTLDGVMTKKAGAGAPALWIKNSSGKVTIRLRGENVLYGRGNCAGLQKEGTGTLEITSASGGTQGELTAESSGGGAGIGGGRGQSASGITISGGTVTAVGYGGGAGIGSGDGGSASNITISGGNVIAVGAGGAGIGSGVLGTASNITISGGDVTATGANGGAGIGSGHSGSAGDITISGGNVKAEGTGGAGIGGGTTGSASSIGSITISGGNVTAVGYVGGAGIGGGQGGSGGNITISSGEVSAIGKNGGAGIGGGSGGGGGTVDISGADTVVTAKSQISINSIVPGCAVGGGANSSDGGSLSVTGGATLIMDEHKTNVQTPIYNNCTVKVGDQIIYPPAPVPAPDNTGGSSGGSSGGGGSSRSSGSGSAGTPLLKGRTGAGKVRMIAAAALERLAAQAEAADRDYAVLSSAQPVEIQGNAWGALKDFPLAVQMTEAGAVRLQLVLPDPAKLTGPLALDAAGAEDAAARFGKWFQNPLTAVAVGYEGALGQLAQAAVWTGWDANGSAPLRVYRYDAKANAYREAEDAEPWIDKNGYARFSVPEGGVYVISIGPLKRR